MYKPTTAKYVGRTQTVYVVYEQTWMHNYRGHRKRRTQTRVNRVYVSGRIVKIDGPGYFVNKLGRRVYGLKITYETPRKAFSRSGYIREAHRRKAYTKDVLRGPGVRMGRISATTVKSARVGPSRMPRTEARVTKIVELPKGARKVRITRRPPKGPLMDVR